MVLTPKCMKSGPMSSFLDMFKSEVLVDRDGQQVVKWVTI